MDRSANDSGQAPHVYNSLDFKLRIEILGKLFGIARFRFFHTAVLLTTLTSD